MLLLGGMLCGGLLSCKKLLDLKPEDSVYEAVFWKTETDATSGLMGAYSLLRKSLTLGGQGMSNFVYGDFTTGVLKEGGDYALNFLVKGDEYYGTGISVDDFRGDYIEDFQNWTPYFKTITQANTVIEKVGKMPDNAFKSLAVKRKIIGEALFIRAYTYFYMVRIWGDVPLVLQYDQDPVSSKNVQRTNEAVVLDSCAADMNRARLLMGWNTGSDHAVRADKGAAFALLAHVNRWKYFVTKESDKTLLTKSIAAIDSITASGMYSLVPAANFDRLFKGRSQEGIFEINTSADQLEYQPNGGFYLYTLGQPYIPEKTKSTVFNSEVVGWFFNDPTDARYDYYFDRTKEEDLILTKYIGKNNQNRFFLDPGNNRGGLVNCNISIFRLAEMKLLRAECNELLGRSSDALTDLNDVKLRSNLTGYSGADLKTEIFEETFRELFCEGHSWYDMVRNKRLVEYLDRFPQSRFDEEGWKWPIARSLFVTNKDLAQNKYWVGRLR
ncbi:SusD family protein [Pedobacter steynii]|uniref:SusD family protein n=1 Tax=Pedobacter steynii TaxID=430522 RepID=A0A1G9YWM1_9SPHI|nr:RagB/SusD family nutrient uptake outer membrane protein [Pedobacter steynii]NQX39863.1 RagB/SusD family nutrient uptake outer membrane protein [Pedobacter steynii]SDN13548.1 SusD family protein [Pedobacter steynii]